MWQGKRDGASKVARETRFRDRVTLKETQQLSHSVSTPGGAARYIDRADDAAEFFSTLRGTAQVALDTEGASFHKFLDRIYLLQLSTRSGDTIIDPLSAGILPGLVELLANPATEVVLHDADYDLRLLRQDYGVTVRNIFDTRVAAQLLGIRSFGLAALLEKYFAVKLEKKYQRADWSLRPLTPGMLEYAVLDTHFLLRLRDALESELKAKGRWDWAREEFAGIEGEHARAERGDSSEAFLKVRGARDLTRRELAALKHLVAWRDDTARRMDRAAFRVAANDILLEIARLRPRDRSALAGIRIVPRVLVERESREILAAVRAGELVPEDELPQFQKSPRRAKDPSFEDRVNALRKVRDAVATRLDLEPGVLCSRDRLEAVARARPKTADELTAVPVLRRWQIEALGADLLRELKA